MRTLVRILRDEPPPASRAVGLGFAVVGVLLIGLDVLIVASELQPGESLLRRLLDDSLGELLLGLACLAAPAGLLAMAGGTVLAALVAAPTDSSIVVALLVPWIAFFVGRHLRAGALLFFTASHLMAGVVATVLHPYGWVTLVIMGPGLAAGVAVGLFTRRLGVVARQAQEASVRAYEQQDRAIALLRRSMARDLHDVVAQNLSVIALQAEASRYLTDRDHQAQVLDTVASMARQTHTDLRGLLDVLYASTAQTPPALSPEEDLTTVTGMSLAHGVERSVEHLRAQGFTVDPRIHLPDEAEVPRSVQTTMDRVLQEASANVVKHAAPGTDVEVDVRVVGRELRLHVANALPAEGGGSRAEPGSGGYGLLNIGERAHLLGGHADIAPEEGRWHVRVTLPLPH